MVAFASRRPRRGTVSNETAVRLLKRGRFRRRLPIHRAKNPRNSPGDNIALLMSGSISFQKKTVVLKHLFQGKNYSPVDF
jgi:hypothetical protein